MKSVDELWDHIAYVVLYAPDDFPQEDFLAPDDQMTMDRAFELLRAGVMIAYPEGKFAQKRLSLMGLLDRSFLAYRSEDEMTGVKLLHEFQDAIFKQ